MLNLHLCVRRSGVLGVEMKTLPVKHTARTLSGSPSTRAAIAMDGGVAAYKCCCCCSTQRAQPPDPQAREPLSLWTEAWPTHNLLLHRPLVGGGSRGGGRRSLPL